MKTITVAGYGENAYYNGGGNISASPDAPQKWVRVPEYEKALDLEHDRMRVRQRNHNNFVFAGLAGYLGAPNPAWGSSTAPSPSTSRPTAAACGPATRWRVPAESTC